MNSSPIIIELVGPAGAGKTTLANALIRQDKRMRLVCFPNSIGIKEALFYARNMLSLMPVIFSSTSRALAHGHWRKFRRKELSAMCLLNGWYADLEKNTPASAPFILLDQGPFNLLGHLNVWLFRGEPDPAITTWYEKMCRSWAERLRIVIILDAEDDTLIQRIRSRQQSHGLKEKTSQEMSTVLDTYRLAYKRVVTHMEAAGHKPTILNYDTTQALNEANYQEFVSKICDGIKL